MSETFAAPSTSSACRRQPGVGHHDRRTTDRSEIPSTRGEPLYLVRSQWLCLAALSVVLAITGGCAGGSSGSSSHEVAGQTSSGANTPRSEPPTTATTADSAATSWASGRTEVVVYEPFTPSGLASDVSATATKAGYCWTSSDATQRSDAFRCMSGNEIFDPSFSNPYGKSEVACPESGPSQLIVLDLTQPLPSVTGDQSANTPWRFQLADGAICEIATGATATIDGMRLNGSCRDSASWVGSIDESNEPWSVLIEQQGSSQLVSTQIKEAWE